MARRFSVEHTYQPYFVGGLLVSHATQAVSGFRLRDATFFINLVSNWLEYFLPENVLGATSIQTLRYLDGLTKQGYVKRLKNGKHPRFTLTRPGIIELVSRLSSPNSFTQFEHFLFAYYFLKCYGTQIERLVQDSSGQLTPAFRAKLETLCNTDLLKLKQLRFIEERLRKLKDRFESTQGVIDLCKGEGKITDCLLTEIETKYPYQLNSERSMYDLLQSLPPEIRNWELKDGNRFRLNLLWQPTREILSQQLDILKKLE